MAKVSLEQIKDTIVDVKDFPKSGIVFKDITPLFEEADIFLGLVEHLSELIPKDTTKLVAIESRGFILASALAAYNKLPFCLVRKPNKLPREVYKKSYDLEYGSDELQIHTTSLKPSDKVLIVDDVLATGGTACAVEALCLQCKVSHIESLFLMELTFLEGSSKLNFNHNSLIKL